MACSPGTTRNQQLAHTQKRMGEHFTPNQLLGRTHTIGCVAVEITQKCNLDCTLCYLSEHSQAVRDIPIQEVFKRLDSVLHHYGPGTSVQITGGDPTLRKRSELIDIVEYANKLGLHTALFTNGIAATRELLTALAHAGLNDVAFHVDTTQEREGYADEQSLNDIRKAYIARAKGLGLMVIFNTTVHTGNFHELPMMVDFFVKHAHVVSFASFQLQAETGRGEWGARTDVVDPLTVKAAIEKTINKALPWEKVRIGHSDCHSYMPTLVADNQVFSVVDDEQLFAQFIKDFNHIQTTRQHGKAQIAWDYTKALLKQPQWLWLLAKATSAKLLEMRGSLVRSRGRVHKLSFFVQNFMDATALQQDRIDACSFMVMTADGPVSMCKHNAQRDEYILKPLTYTNHRGQVKQYQPLGERYKQDNVIPIRHLPTDNAKAVQVNSEGLSVTSEAPKQSSPFSAADHQQIPKNV
ncbi:radical SAM protein [Alteromonas sp. C1M14]|uniref:radical SAM protein n=1 Tax=Alteromonas sp. C1M14 TaxID=2841567 RepID=UPI001C096946|nr:radical SAM protein [Alteromonas sp. C1M14]MBU2976836.1 radical SAM protein [Alteromonas sp. C1M14]